MCPFISLFEPTASIWNKLKVNQPHCVHYFTNSRTNTLHVRPFSPVPQLRKDLVGKDTAGVAGISMFLKAHQLPTSFSEQLMGSISYGNT